MPHYPARAAIDGAVILGFRLIQIKRNRAISAAGELGHGRKQTADAEATGERNSLPSPRGGISVQ